MKIINIFFAIAIILMNINPVLAHPERCRDENIWVQSGYFIISLEKNSNIADIAIKYELKYKRVDGYFWVVKKVVNTCEDHSYLFGQLKNDNHIRDVFTTLGRVGF